MVSDVEKLEKLQVPLTAEKRFHAASKHPINSDMKFSRAVWFISLCVIPTEQIGHRTHCAGCALSCEHLLHRDKGARHQESDR
jgi:hypothetical protein